MLTREVTIKFLVGWWLKLILKEIYTVCLPNNAIGRFWYWERFLLTL